MKNNLTYLHTKVARWHTKINAWSENLKTIATCKMRKVTRKWVHEKWVKMVLEKAT